MLELLKAGGWLMVPILICSVIAFSIIVERIWTLQKKKVAPNNLVLKVWHWEKNGTLDKQRINSLAAESPLGKILAAGLLNRHHKREIMKESIEEAGRHVVHEMERFLTSLGTIASITPLLGLLGTVIGMIKVFAVITTQGLGDTTVLSAGISEALITTAAGLAVAIPTLMMYRYLQGHIDSLIVMMEQEAIKMVEVMHGEREKDEAQTKAEQQALDASDDDMDDDLFGDADHDGS